MTQFQIEGWGLVQGCNKLISLFYSHVFNQFNKDHANICTDEESQTMTVKFLNLIVDGH